MSDRVDERVVVEGGQVRVLGLDEHHVGRVVPRELHLERVAVVQVGESHTVLGADRLSDDHLVDVVELVPVLLAIYKYSTCFD